MMRRWAIRIGVACAGLFLFSSRFRIFSRRGDDKSHAPLSVAEDPIDKPESSDRANPTSIVKSVAGISAALATLILAYLAVAVSAHWFPWETRIPSVAVELNSKQSQGKWNSAINALTNFLTSNYTHIAHLNLELNNFTGVKSDSRAMSDLVENVQSMDILYKRTSSDPATITAIYLGANCGNLSNVDCTILTLNLVTGPGSNLGYVTQGAANTISIYGYYQIGAVGCQTSTCAISLIPVEPPT